MKSTFSISKEQVAENIEKITSFINNQGIDAMYVSSYDCFLNEYVPMEECHRYYFTHFTGSVAEVLATKNGKVHLFVDGRYFEQADLEITNPNVVVEKVTYGVGLKDALLNKVNELNIKTVGIEGDRCPYGFKNKLSELSTVKSFNDSELMKVVSFSSHAEKATLEEVDLNYVGMNPSLKLNMVLKENEGMFVSALDSISWLTNLRGYQLPFQSSFKAKCLAFRDKIYLFVDEHTTVPNVDGIEVFVVKNYSLIEHISYISSKHSVDAVNFDPASMNAADYEILASNFGTEKMKTSEGGLIPFHAAKNKNEIAAMDEAFKKGDKAIYETLKWMKAEIKAGNKVTELEFYNKTNEIYKENGAKAQSFNTIAAVGANSSIIHFSTPSDDVIATKDDLLLLDSGAYFESGYATDTTRAFMGGGTPTMKQKEVYTLVLKGLLQAQNAVFPNGTWGCAIDSLARMGMRLKGYDFAHGTGHGVGINVHEGGFRLSPTSQTPLVENVAGSIEPGIYLPGFGGVRLENIVVTEKHPELEGMLRFRPFVYIGFEHELIERSLLTKEEEVWLDEYEEECKKRGTSFLD